MQTRGYPEYSKKMRRILETETSLCPDCGTELPLGDDVVRKAHFAACPAKATPVTLTEVDELAACEERIDRGFKIWQEVSEALLYIRDKRLYRATHKTFEEYCEKRWQMTRRNMNYIIDAGEVYANLGKIFPKNELPQSASQALELASLATDVQQLSWQVVRETAPGGKITAAHVKSVKNVLTEAISAGAIDDGTGEQIPVESATPTHFKAAIVEETYERMRRQEAHIVEHQAKRNPSPQTLATEEYEWYTPLRYLDAARSVLGAIDLDPASSAIANRNVEAVEFYTREQDGLVQPWQGRVWLNPPYGAAVAPFVARLTEAYAAGSVTEAILLVNANGTDTKWFQPLWNHVLCFTNHRIDFISPHGEQLSSSTHGSVFVYFGAQPERFAEVFAEFGTVVRRFLP